MERQTFIETLYAERVKWKALLDEVPHERIDEPGACGKWLVRDLIAHIAIWERWASYLALGVIENREMSYAELFGKELLPEVEAMEYDPFNEWLVEQIYDKLLDEIMPWEANIFSTFVDRIRQLDEDDFGDPTRQFPGMDWKGERALWDVLASNSYKHYQLHAQDIRGWLAMQTNPAE
jgi:hypothetical protein